MAEQQAPKQGVMALLAIDHLMWKRHLQRKLTPHGISLKQHYLLSELRRNGVLQPARIAEMLFCDRPTVSVVLRNLVKKGWVSRKPDPENAKQVLVSLTPEGRGKVEEIEGSENAFASAPDPLACFIPSEVKELQQLLRRLHDHLLEVTV